MDKLKPSGKSFDISKWEVWEAYRQVKANRGAPGVDGVTLEEFDKDLKNNLYKIWNRMSSGSYFPPPVKAVEIPKPHGGGTRTLGVPTISDRVAQTVVARRLEAKVEPIFHPDSYGYRPHRSALDAVAACRERCWKTDWVIDLDIQKFFDSVDHALMVKAVAGPRRCSVGGAVCQAVADRPAGTARRDLATARPGHPARVRGLAGTGQPVHALRVRHVDGPGIPGHPVRTLCRRRGRALCHRTPSQESGGRDRGQDGTGRAATASRQDENGVLPRREPPTRLRAHGVYVLGVHFSCPCRAHEERRDVRLVPAGDQQRRPEQDQRVRSADGGCTAGSGSPSPRSPDRSTLSCAAGCSTTGRSTAPSCIRSYRASTPT